MSTSPLIDCTALAALLQDPHTLLVDCRSDLLDHQWGQRQYEAGHLPGAASSAICGAAVRLGRERTDAHRRL